MTIRLQACVNGPIGNQQIAALITESILTPTNDDAPASAAAKPQGGWGTWVRSQIKPSSRVD